MFVSDIGGGGGKRVSLLPAYASVSRSSVSPSVFQCFLSFVALLRTVSVSFPSPPSLPPLPAPSRYGSRDTVFTYSTCTHTYIRAYIYIRWTVETHRAISMYILTLCRVNGNERHTEAQRDGDGRITREKKRQRERRERGRAGKR